MTMKPSMCKQEQNYRGHGMYAMPSGTNGLNNHVDVFISGIHKKRKKEKRK